MGLTLLIGCDRRAAWCYNSRIAARSHLPVEKAVDHTWHSFGLYTVYKSRNCNIDVDSPILDGEKKLRLGCFNISWYFVWYGRWELERFLYIFLQNLPFLSWHVFYLKLFELHFPWISFEITAGPNGGKSDPAMFHHRWRIAKWTKIQLRRQELSETFVYYVRSRLPTWNSTERVHVAMVALGQWLSETKSLFYYFRSQLLLLPLLSKSTKRARTCVWQWLCQRNNFHNRCSTRAFHQTRVCMWQWFCYGIPLVELAYSSRPDTHSAEPEEPPIQVGRAGVEGSVWGVWTRALVYRGM